MRDLTRRSVCAISANRQGLSRFSSATAALYSATDLGHVSTAARSAVSASALFPFTMCHWPKSKIDSLLLISNGFIAALSVTNRRTLAADNQRSEKAELYVIPWRIQPAGVGLELGFRRLARSGSGQEPVQHCVGVFVGLYRPQQVCRRALEIPGVITRRAEQ